MKTFKNKLSYNFPKCLNNVVSSKSLLHHIAEKSLTILVFMRVLMSKFESRFHPAGKRCVCVVSMFRLKLSESRSICCSKLQSSQAVSVPTEFD